MMKDEIFLQTMFAQGYIKYLDAKTKTDSEVPDNLKNF